jgi:hypothetical protein
MPKRHTKYKLCARSVVYRADDGEIDVDPTNFEVGTGGSTPNEDQSAVVVKIDANMSTEKVLKAIRLISARIRREGVPKIACPMPFGHALLLMDKLNRIEELDNNDDD